MVASTSKVPLLVDRTENKSFIGAVTIFCYLNVSKTHISSLSWSFIIVVKPSSTQHAFLSWLELELPFSVLIMPAIYKLQQHHCEIP